MRAAKLILRGGLALCALAALPANAQASQVEVDTDSSGRPILRYEAGAAEVNRVSVLVAVNFQNEAFVDDSVDLIPLAGCRRAGDRTQVACEIGAEILARVHIDLGDRDDNLIYRVAQGATNPFPDLVLDGPGNDRVQLDSWATRAANGPGHDRFTCVSECRVLTGSVAGVGNVSGGGNDRIYGSPAADRLMGGTGRDVIFGGRGGDRLYGGSGDDSLYGQAGNDWLFGGPGMDGLSGGPGTDRLFQ